MKSAFLNSLLVRSKHHLTPLHEFTTSEFHSLVHFYTFCSLHNETILRKCFWGFFPIRMWCKHNFKRGWFCPKQRWLTFSYPSGCMYRYSYCLQVHSWGDDIHACFLLSSKETSVDCQAWAYLMYSYPGVTTEFSTILDIQIVMRRHWSACSLHKVKLDIIEKVDAEYLNVNFDFHPLPFSTHPESHLPIY